MSIEIIHDFRTGTAAMYDNTTEWAFGPVASDCHICGMGADDLLDEFMGWAERKREVRDLRMVNAPDLFQLWADYCKVHGEHQCRDCEGTGNVVDGPNEVTCGACGGAGRLGGKTVEDEAVEAATGERIR